MTRTSPRVAVAAALLAGLIGLAGAAAPAAATTPPAPSTPPAANASDTATAESTITRYVSSLATGDLSGALAVWAIREQAENFTLEDHVEHLGVFNPFNDLLPSSSPMYIEMNVTALTARAQAQARMFIYSTLGGLDGRDPMLRWDRAQTAAFVGAIDPAKLASLKVVKIGDMTARFPRYAAIAAPIARIAGGEEITERIAMVDVRGSTYLMGFVLVRYGSEWKIVQQYSSLADTGQSGMAKPITPAEFDGLLDPALES